MNKWGAFIRLSIYFRTKILWFPPFSIFIAMAYPNIFSAKTSRHIAAEIKIFFIRRNDGVDSQNSELTFGPKF